MADENERLKGAIGGSVGGLSVEGPPREAFGLKHLAEAAGVVMPGVALMTAPQKVEDVGRLVSETGINLGNVFESAWEGRQVAPLQEVKTLNKALSSGGGAPPGAATPGAPGAPRPTGAVVGGGYNPRLLQIRALQNAPPEYHGGHLMPVDDEELNADIRRLEHMVATGQMSPEQAQQRYDYLSQNLGKWQQSSEGIAAQMQKQQMKADQNQLGYQMTGMEQQAGVAGQIAGMEQQLTEEMQAREQAREMKRDAAVRAQAEQTRQWEQAQKAVANFRVDPDRYMKKQGGWGQVRTTIGLMLGTMGSSLTKGPNSALQFLERRIEQDLDAQKEELGAKKAGAEGKGRILAVMRQQYMDEEQAYAASKRFLLQQTALEARALADASKPEAIRRQANAMADAAQARAEMIARGQELQARQRMELELQQLMMPRGGGGGKKPRAENSKSVMEAREAHRALTDKVANLKRIRSQMGVMDWLSVQVGQPTELAKQAMKGQRDLMQLQQRGVLTDADAEAMKEFTPGPLSFKEVVSGPDNGVLDSALQDSASGVRAAQARSLSVEDVEDPVVAERERRKERDK